MQVPVVSLYASGRAGWTLAHILDFNPEKICNLQAEAAVEQTVGNEQYKKKRTVVHLVYLKSIPSEWWLGTEWLECWT